MDTASIKIIKDELASRDKKELLGLCLKLARFKKENKELLTYLLFDSTDEVGFVERIKEELEGFFQEMHPSNVYFAKKTIRKIIRYAARYIRYSDDPTTEIEVYLFVCRRMNSLKVAWKSSTSMINLYNAQQKKIRKAVEGLHEDLQYDYLKQLETIE